MTVLEGTGVFGGIAMGRIVFYQRKQTQVEACQVENSEKEWERFEKARSQAAEQLGRLYEKALQKVGEKDAMVFQIHQMMLEDPDYCEAVQRLILAQKRSAEYAINATGKDFAEMLSKTEDPLTGARAEDVQDISRRLLRILRNEEELVIDPKEPVIVAAEDLAPSETVRLDRKKVLAFITERGSANSHTAILARAMNIPAVVNVAGLKIQCSGQYAIVDGLAGKIYLDPEESTIKFFMEKRSQEVQKRQTILQWKERETTTLEGKKVRVCCNISGPEDLAAALENGAEGIGLFRSEFLYLGKKDYPSEEEQFQAYKLTAEAMAGKRVVIRTLDIGADKKAEYFNLSREENPALGCRGIRLCLDRREMFKAQLRAIYRASAFGNISVMFPMITSVEEVKEIKQIVKSVMQELNREHIRYNKTTELGVMIETPAAALISDELANEVDFFSLGTNDLTQYTLAVDRQNESVAKFYNPQHKALLRLVKMAADSARNAGIWVGICGELAANLFLTEAFLAMGIEEFSVAPPYVLPLREKICGIDVEKIKRRVFTQFGLL